MTSPIIDFIEARLEEDWQIACEASQDGDAGNTWSVGAHRREFRQEARIGDDREDLVFDIKDGVCVGFDELLAFLTRHDPARVLREVAAKRRVMERHYRYDGSALYDYCAGCPSGDDSGYPEVELNDCPELRDLAAPYSNHPDFDPNWSTT